MSERCPTTNPANDEKRAVESRPLIYCHLQLFLFINRFVLDLWRKLCYIRLTTSNKRKTALDSPTQHRYHNRSLRGAGNTREVHRSLMQSDRVTIVAYGISRPYYRVFFVICQWIKCKTFAALDLVDPERRFVLVFGSEDW